MYGENGMIHIGAKAKVIFMHNVAHANGGSIYLKNMRITFDTNSNANFANNSAYNGGAIYISNGAMNIDINASLIFSHNCAGLDGRVIYLQNYAELNI